MAQGNFFEQIAKAIQSDEKGLGYFTSEEGLVEFLVTVIETDVVDAKQTAHHMLNEDRKHSRYYYLPEGGGPMTLADYLRNISKRGNVPA